MPTTEMPAVSLQEPDSGCVAEFERALADRTDRGLRGFLPPSSEPGYVPTLVEMVRVDIERRWERGDPKRIAEYLAEFPELLGAEALAALAFEDYRARLRAGRPVPDAPRDTLATSELLTTMRQPIEPLAGGWDDEPAALPAVGDTFLGFRLTDELGRGAFGRVYLACQGELSGRPVALKVGTGLFTESQTLAQLQHTNIVPIYSLHRTRQLQAVCMPYFGRTTLAHVLTGIRGQAVFPSSGHALLSTLHLHATSTTPDRPADETAEEGPASVAPSVGGEPDATAKALLGRLSYPDAVVWVGAQLAAGLAHAHERGIVHRDIKPANILLTDDGVPMLLDFNLAHDAKARGPAGAAVGGTLPYMSPEQLETFDQPSAVDAKSDVYSLGVVLFELLTGHRPFADKFRGPLKEIVRHMRDARLAGAPSARSVNRAVSHGVDAIVRRCMAPSAGDRYPSARDLQEDLERHLKNEPLRHVRVRSWRERACKWAARHPRLSSSYTIAAIAALLLAGLTASAMYARERIRTYRAAEVFRSHCDEFRALQVFFDDRNQSVPAPEAGLDRCRVVLARYGIADDGADDEWEGDVRVRYLDEPSHQALREDVGEVFYLMARTASQQAADDPARRAELADRAVAWHRRATAYASGRIPRALLEQQVNLAYLNDQPGIVQEAIGRANATETVAARDWYLIGSGYAQLGRYRAALPYLRKATLTDPEHFSAWFVRGTSHLALEQNEMAAMCFGSCIALNKKFAPAWLNRGLAYNRLRFFEQACDDYDQALRLDPGLINAYLQRANAKESLGDLSGAVADLTVALDSGAAPTRVYFYRAHLRDQLGEKAAAAADRTEGLKRRPADDMSWVARAENRLDTPHAALADLDEALRLNPLCMFAMQLKAHILAERLNRPAEAILVLDRAVELFPEFVPARAGRGVLLARRGERAAAIRDAEEALLRDTKGPNRYQVACIYALTSTKEPADRPKALELLRAGLRTGFGLDIVDTDADLDPIRKDPAFARIVAEARAMHPSR